MIPEVSKDPESLLQNEYITDSRKRNRAVRDLSPSVRSSTKQSSSSKTEAKPSKPKPGQVLLNKRTPTVPRNTRVSQGLRGNLDLEETSRVRKRTKTVRSEETPLETSLRLNLSAEQLRQIEANQELSRRAVPESPVSDRSSVLTNLSQLSYQQGTPGPSRVQSTRSNSPSQNNPELDSSLLGGSIQQTFTVAVPFRRALIMATAMPEPGVKSPKFSSDKPIELNRFIEQCESLFTKHSVNADAEKIRWCRRYADCTADNEWGAFDQTSFASFKRELLESYPEPEVLREGSLTILRRLCEGSAGIRIEDRADIMNFKRKFTAEAKKLTDGADPIIGNRELCMKIWDVIHPDFASEVRVRLLTMQRAAVVPVAGVPVVTRRRDDPHNWADILTAMNDAAREVSGLSTRSNERGSYGGSSRSGNGDRNSVKREDLEAFEARLTDRSKIANDALMSVMEERIKGIYAQIPQGRPAMQPGQFQYGTQNQRPEEIRYQGCFGCGKEGHRIGDCPRKFDLMNKGFIKEVDRRIVLPNGQMIPRDLPGKTILDKAEEWNRIKADVNLFGMEMPDYYDSDFAQGQFSSYYSEPAPPDPLWKEVNTLREQMSHLKMYTDREKESQAKAKEEKDFKDRMDAYMLNHNPSPPPNAELVRLADSITLAQLEQIKAIKQRGNGLESSQGFK